jgi:hypothetical protein
VLSTRLFTHGEIIATDMSEAPKIEAKLRVIGRNIIASIAATMQEVPE